jgi:glycosyltransferase involved in cell wall biosynthesis
MGKLHGNRDQCVSVILPCFNQGKFLRQAIESILAQSYSCWECIIIDDGSTDETSAVAKQLKSNEERIVYVRTANLGVSAARNTGMAQAKGDFIQYLDADDYLEEHKFRMAVDQFRCNHDTDIVVSDFRYFPNGNSSAKWYGINANAPEWAGPRWQEAIPLTEKLLIYNFIPVCAPIVKNSSARIIGPWDTRLRGCEDWHYWLRASLKGLRFTYSPIQGSNALIRLHTKSASHANHSMLKQEIRMRRLLSAELTGILSDINRERALDALQRSRQRFAFIEKIRTAIDCAKKRCLLDK